MPIEQTTGIEETSMAADLLVIFIPKIDKSSSSFASAAALSLSPIDGRPYLGIYNLNFAGIVVNELNKFHYFNIFAHEFTHILGFSDNLFPHFYYNGGDRPISLTVSNTKFGGIYY